MRLLDRVLGRPGPRRVAADARERDPRVHVAEAPGLDRQVGRLEQDREIGGRRELRALEEVGQRAELRRQLLLAEQEQRHVDRARARRRASSRTSSTRDGDTALHVGRAAAVHGAVGDPAGHVVLRGHRVVVADEEHERHARPAAAARTRTRPRPRTRPRRPRGTSESRCARTSASWRLSDGMSTSSSVRSASRCPRAVMTRAYRHTLVITRRSDTPGRARAREGAPARRAPEGGRCRGRARRAARADAHGARRPGRGARPAAQPARPEDVRRQGQARGAEDALRGRAAPTC